MASPIRLACSTRKADRAGPCLHSFGPSQYAQRTARALHFLWSFFLACLPHRMTGVGGSENSAAYAIMFKSNFYYPLWINGGEVGVDWVV